MLQKPFGFFPNLTVFNLNIGPHSRSKKSVSTLTLAKAITCPIQGLGCCSERGKEAFTDRRSARKEIVHSCILLAEEPS